MGWLFAMFDLPVGTKAERRRATNFRKALLEDGFMMIQYSVYARPCVSHEKMCKYRSRVQAYIPGGGNVRLVYITDKQWKHSITVIGADPRRRRPPETMPKQQEFW